MPTPIVDEELPVSGAASKPQRLRLHRWHKDHGAEFKESRGFLLPWSYSGSEDMPEKGLLDLSDHSRLELVGADRQRFLGGLVTCAVSDLAAGRGVYGFVTSIKGKVLADVVVSAFDDRLFLLLPPGRGQAVKEHLCKYVVADRVEVLPLTDLLPIALVGDEISSLLPNGCWPGEPWACGMMELFGTEVPVSRHERLGVPALVAWVSSSIVEPVVNEWLEGLDLKPVGGAAREAARVKQGLPAFGIDYGEENLAQESGVEAIDFTKGCYLGQEVIARLHYRGQAPKVVRRVVLSGEGVDRISAGAEVFSEGRAAGRLTTVVNGVALGMVQRRAAAAGTAVVVGAAEAGTKGGVLGRVEEL